MKTGYITVARADADVAIRIADPTMVAGNLVRGWGSHDAGERRSVQPDGVRCRCAIALIRIPPGAAQPSPRFDRESQHLPLGIVRNTAAVVHHRLILHRDHHLARAGV
jgi:hypothetical protein